jgi:hypothetical protein
MTNPIPATTPDAWIPITEISAALRDLTGDPGPGYRRLSTLAADGKIAPPMEKQGGRFWGCYQRNLPKLAKTLGLAPLNANVRTPRRARNAEVSVRQAAA